MPLSNAIMQLKNLITLHQKFCTWRRLSNQINVIICSLKSPRDFKKKKKSITFTGNWSQSQMTLGERQGKPWARGSLRAGRQFISGRTLIQTTIESHIYTCGWFRAAIVPNQHVFELWEKTRAPRVNSSRCRGNMQNQTNRKALFDKQVWTQSLFALRATMLNTSIQP